MRPEIDFEIVKLMLEVGLLAPEEQMCEAAECILTGVAAYQPNLPESGIALAFFYYTQRKQAEAVDLLRNQVLKAFPDNPMGKSMLGLILYRTGQSGWRELLTAVIADGSHAAAVKMARSILDDQDAPPAPRAPGVMLPLHARPA